ncbi:MAG: hypothetical protein IJK87_02630 [Prevotella sp.]|nr:hypothetical protein [Prevotella sp.]
MNTLRLDYINLHAPYRVWQKQNKPYHYYFVSDAGVEFDVDFNMDYAFVPSGAFEFSITNERHGKSPLDDKLKKTIIAIVEEFFEQNNEVMLYVTATGDGRQASRNRLFVRWFKTYEHHHLYYVQTAEGIMDDQMNFIAILSRLTCPHLQQAIEEFNETVSLLFDQ